MIAAIFSYRGRLNRRQYLLGNLAVGTALAVLAAMFIGFVERAPTSRPGLAMDVDAVLLVIAAPLAVWSAVSLQARRMRDVGLEPLLVIPLWLCPLGLVQNWPLLAVSMNLALLACLFAWPGRRDALSSLSSGGYMLALAQSSAPVSRQLDSGRRRR